MSPRHVYATINRTRSPTPDDFLRFTYSRFESEKLVKTKLCFSGRLRKNFGNTHKKKKIDI